MAFKLKLYPNHTTGLVAVCDVCGSEAKEGDANILWHPTGREKPGDGYPYQIACKGKCTQLVDNRAGSCAHSQEITTAIFYLFNSVGGNYTDEQERARFLAQF